MTSKIRVLTDDTINKIAAGEVIENPASVVKELVENSIDAGATEIVIEIKGGGRQLIRITDNGSGMSRDDALLCLERHATSKIQSVDDLEGILTMGFRGEAIPSIASISQFTLLTSLHQAPKGTLILMDGGKITNVADAACPFGTSIEVKNLFFNVPVRRKFLKSPSVDSNEIVKMVSKIALGNPRLKFQLLVDGKNEIQTIRLDSTSFEELLKSRIGDILGREMVESCRYVEYTTEMFTLRGYVGTPLYTRHNRTGQWLFINGRAVQSPMIGIAVKEGYGPSLAPGRYPVFVLHLEVSGSLVDVNVHPQKREVRLRQEQFFREHIAKAVQASVQQTTPYANSYLPDQRENSGMVSPVFAQAVRTPTLFVAEEVAPWHFSEKPLAPLPISPAPYVPKLSVAQKIDPQLFHYEKAISLKYRFIASIPGYLIAEGTEGILIIDQKAAHCRILYEKFVEGLQGKAPPIQPLLVPYSIELLTAEASELRVLLPELQRLGIQIREFGPRTFLIDAVPELLQNEDIGKLILDLLNSGIESANDELISGVNERARRTAIAMNKQSVSSKRRLSAIEGQGLMDQLTRCENPNRCPQGKPISFLLTGEGIANLFDRIKC